MVSKNNFKNKMEQTAARTPHYGIRKLSVGVASVLISTTLYMGATTAKADTLPSTATDVATTKPETASSSSSTQDNTTVDKTVETTTGVANNSTDTSVSATPNAQASTTNTTAGATSSDKSGANSNSLVANNVESTANTTAQAQQAAKDAEEKAKALAQAQQAAKDAEEKAKAQVQQAQQPKVTVDQSDVVAQWNADPGSKPTEKWKYESQSGSYYQQEVQQATKDAEEKAKAQAQQAAKDAEEKAKALAQAQQAAKDAEEKAKAQVQQATKDAEEKAKVQAQAKAEHTYFAKTENGKVVDEKGHIMVGYSVKGNQVFDAQSKLVGTLAQTSTTRRMANTVKQENAKVLPQTGDKQNNNTTVGAILVGLGSLLGLGALGKRKEK